MGEPKTMAVDLPSELYKNFKIKCVQEGKSIKSVIIDFVREYAEVEDNEPSKTDSPEDEKG